MNTLLTLAFDSDDMSKVIVVGLGCLTFAVYAVASSLSKSSTEREREQTKREVAAYVAEGSMTVEDAERILSGKRQKKNACTGDCAGAKKA